MKLPALRLLPLLIACGLLSAPSLHSQEAPSRDRSSREAAEGKLAPTEKVRPIAKGKQQEISRITVAVKEIPKKAPAPEPSGIMILFEWIEVEHEDFSDWAFENKLAVDATELRKEVQMWVKEDDAGIVRSALIHARSGQRAMAESIEEVIYATSFDPAESPNTITLEEAEAPVVPPTGGAYETRNVGTTVEVDPVISEDGQLIDLNLSPEMIFYLDDLEWVTESNGQEMVIRQPLFYAAKATTQVEVKSGGYALVATLQMPPTDKDDDDDDDDDDDEERILLLFVRADAS